MEHQKQRNALLGWDLLWYLPLAWVTLTISFPNRLQAVWYDLKALWHWHGLWTFVILPVPLGEEVLYLSILPVWLLYIVPALFRPDNGLFPYRRRSVVASYLVAGAFEFLLQLIIYISWPTCIDSTGNERLSLFPVASSLLGLAFGCFPNRGVILPEPLEFLIFLLVGAVGLVVLVYFARASKNASARP